MMHGSMNVNFEENDVRGASELLLFTFCALIRTIG